MTTLLRVSARPLARIVAAGLLVAVLASCRPMNSSETSLFVHTNELRKQNHLPAYAQQDALVDQARSWAAAMAAQAQLSHSDPHTWNIGWTAVAENVGVSGSIDDIEARLDASPQHRANMLSTQYTHMAVGTARGKDGLLYAVQLFWHA
jgi:uncharacterized protein YkwD